MTRRERILRNVMRYNNTWLIGHARLPVNDRNETQIKRLQRVVIILANRIRKHTPAHGNQIAFDFSQKPTMVQRIKRAFRLI